MHSFSRTPECRKNFYKGHCPPTLHSPYILIGTTFLCPPTLAFTRYTFVYMSNCPPPLPSFISHIFSFALQLCCQLCRKQAIRPAGYPTDDRRKNCRSFQVFRRICGGGPPSGLLVFAPKSIATPLPSLQTASPYSIFSVTIRYVA